ncbi:ATP-binding protein [Paraburkholderia domus]|uniref:ATP-binding protein n=1 Tax=Paraburkholderia domus TaxID=2793075 RepID=UPI0039A7050C
MPESWGLPRRAFSKTSVSAGTGNPSFTQWASLFWDGQKLMVAMLDRLLHHA